MKLKILIHTVAVMGVLAIGLPSCGDSGHTDHSLDIAETLMEERPDSALSILEGMETSRLKSDRLRARYALLKSMALDKNYIDTTTFDVLQPAIDYYPRHGNADEKLRTYYYQGRVYDNAGEYDLAMQTYIQGLENLNEVSDSLTLARMLVAQAALYFREYRIADLAENNLKAAAIYEALDKRPQQLNCSLRALDGAIILNNKEEADSLLSVCTGIIEDVSSLQKKAIPVFLKYAVSFGTEEEVRNRIGELEANDIADSQKITLARAYSRIGEPRKGLEYIEAAEIAPDDILDSLSYWAVKTGVLEEMGEDKASLDAFRNYSRLLEEYHTTLFSNELLFSEKKHAMELEKMEEVRKRENVIVWIVTAVAILLLVTGFIYYRYRINRSARLLAEEKAERLQLEIGLLEDERERLNELLQSQTPLSPTARKAIRERINLLNGLFAKSITNEECYGKDFQKYIGRIKKERQMFQQSIAKALEATHPEFMKYLHDHDLTEREIDYVCLYAIGLRGKEVGNYLNLARHYNISSEIRRKLGLESDGANLGPFIRQRLDAEP